MQIFSQANSPVSDQDTYSFLQTQQIVIWVFCGIIFAYFVFVLVFIPIIKKRKDNANFKKRQELYKKLHRGHEVLLASGIFGELVEKQGEIYFVEIAPNVVIKVNRNYILGFFDASVVEKLAKNKLKPKK